MDKELNKAWQKYYELITYGTKMKFNKEKMMKIKHIRHSCNCGKEVYSTPDKDGVIRMNEVYVCANCGFHMMRENIPEEEETLEAKLDDPSVDFKELDWFNTHVIEERHHLSDHVPEDVNLFDIMERIADITMAGMARTGTIYDDTLDPEILTRAYRNTIELLRKEIEVVE